MMREKSHNTNNTHNDLVTFISYLVTGMRLWHFARAFRNTAYEFAGFRLAAVVPSERTRFNQLLIQEFFRRALVYLQHKVAFTVIGAL